MRCKKTLTERVILERIIEKFSYYNIVFFWEILPFVATNILNEVQKVNQSEEN
jgi:hypothetical protein